MTDFNTYKCQALGIVFGISTLTFLNQEKYNTILGTFRIHSKMALFPTYSPADISNCSSSLIQFLRQSWPPNWEHESIIMKAQRGTWFSSTVNSPLLDVCGVFLWLLFVYQVMAFPKALLYSLWIPIQNFITILWELEPIVSISTMEVDFCQRSSRTIWLPSLPLPEASCPIPQQPGLDTLW